MRILIDFRELTLGIRWDKSIHMVPGIGPYTLYKIIICIPCVMFVFQWDTMKDL